MADLIDRQAAIDAVAEFLYYTSNFDGMRQGFDLSDWKWKMKGVLSDLPSAQQERPKGEWVLQSDDYHEYYECDQCGMAVGLDDVRNFCCNCGADMRGEQDE